MKGDVASMRALKTILDEFSAATGLTINFHKSTFVPMHVSADAAAAMASILGCSVSSFPQTYLGLPLSPYKLRVADYKPLLDSFDRYLCGWKAKLLSYGGRLVLVNAVLGGLAIYFMSSHLLPKTVVDKLDARRRAFLWTGDDKCNGSHCLLNWERVCTSKACGGLGVKNLEDQNHCLLLKFVHKLHEPSLLPWKHWYLNHTSSMDGSFLNRLIAVELPRYRALTSVQIGNGQLTSFWHDKWLLGTTLSQAFPALFSHCTQTSGSVCAVAAEGVTRHLRTRLTRVAREELVLLQSCIPFSHLTDRADHRYLDLSQRTPFSSRGAYHSLHAEDEQNPDAARIWATKLPSKVKFFGWLLLLGRLNSRANLCHKNIRTRDEANCEFCPDVLETDEHIFVLCSRSRAVWSRLGINLLPGHHKTPWLIGCHLPLPDQTRVDATLVLLWHLWKARNAKIFDQLDLPAQEVIRRACLDLGVWRFRYKQSAPSIEAWRAFFSSCC